MTHFPHMISFVLELSKEKKMYDFEEVNAILNACAEDGSIDPMVEPIDESTCHPLDWADVVGVDIFDEVYAEPLYMLYDDGVNWKVI